MTIIENDREMNYYAMAYTIAQSPAIVKKGPIITEKLPNYYTKEMYFCMKPDAY